MGCKLISVLALDFDGVIVNSLHVRDEGFLYAFLPYGEEKAKLAKGYHVNNRGCYRKEKIRRIYREVIGIEPCECEMELAERRFSEYVSNRGGEIVFFSGVDLLKRIKETPVYIVTALPAAEVVSFLKNRGMLYLFADVLGGPVSKLNHLSEIIAKLGVDNQSLLFVGDAENDYRQSLMSGCMFRGIVNEKDGRKFGRNVMTYVDLEECILDLVSDDELELI